MTLSRHAGADDQPLLRIDYGSAYSGALPGPALKDNLLVDQRRLRPDFKHWDVEPHHLATRNPIAINEFLELTMDAKNLQLTFSASPQVSLRGMKAALLYMDDVQGRVNSMSAWVRRGERNGVPAAPAIPQLPPPMAAPVGR